MKRLYLASSFRGEGVAEKVMNDIETKLQKSAPDMKVLYITTAGNLHAPEERDWIDEGRELLKRRGWQVTDYDIADKTEAEVEQALAGQDVVFVQGGQCIYMLEQVQKCNFAAVVKRALDRGMVYIGESTGSIITGQDISPYRFLSRDRRVQPPVLENYQGLGLVNFLLFPHWNCKRRYEKFVRIYREFPEEFFQIDQPMIFLNDNQLVYVEDEKLQIWK